MFEAERDRYRPLKDGYRMEGHLDSAELEKLYLPADGVVIALRASGDLKILYRARSKPEDYPSSSTVVARAASWCLNCGGVLRPSACGPVRVPGSDRCARGPGRRSALIQLMTHKFVKLFRCRTRISTATQHLHRRPIRIPVNRRTRK